METNNTRSLEIYITYKQGKKGFGNIMVSIGVVSLRKIKSGDRRRVEVMNFTNEEIAGLYWSKIPSPGRQVEDFKLGNLEKEKIGVTVEQAVEKEPKKRKDKSKKTRDKRDKTSSHRYLGSKGSELIGVRHHPIRCQKLSEPARHLCSGPAWDEACVQPETLWPALKGLFRGIRDLFSIKTSMYRIYGE